VKPTLKDTFHKADITEPSKNMINIAHAHILEKSFGIQKQTGQPYAKAKPCIKITELK